jgi:hypothetical protein
LLGLIEIVLIPVELAHTLTIGDDVTDAVDTMVDEWVLVIIGDSLANTVTVTVDDKEGTTVNVAVIDASIETDIV